MTLFADPPYRDAGARTLWDRVFRVKAALAIVIVMWSIDRYLLARGESTRAVWRENLGFDWDILTSWRWWQVFTGTFIQDHGGIIMTMVIGALLTTSTIEMLAGSRVVLLVAFGSDWVSTFVTTLWVKASAMAGDASMVDLLTHPESGSSSLTHGAGAAAIALLPRRFQAILAPLGIGLLVYEVFKQRPTTNVAHLVATAFGLICGLIVRARANRARSQDASPDSSLA